MTCRPLVVPTALPVTPIYIHWSLSASFAHTIGHGYTGMLVPKYKYLYGYSHMRIYCIYLK